MPSSRFSGREGLVTGQHAAAGQGINKLAKYSEAGSIYVDRLEITMLC